MLLKVAVLESTKLPQYISMKHAVDTRSGTFVFLHIYACNYAIKMTIFGNNIVVIQDVICNEKCYYLT